MKTGKILVLIFSLVLTNSLMAQNFDFRNANWGMDSTQVKNVEKGKFVSSNNKSLQYSGKLGDWEATIIYDFSTNNQLWHASYIVKLKDKNPQSYVNTFLLLQTVLTNKYKEPYLKITSTINGKVITQDEWASNLISDNLNLETKWKNEKTNVVLSLFSINDDLILEVNYNSIAADKKNNEDKKQQLTKDL